MASGIAVWTIGHSNHDPARFLELLECHSIELVVDVRSAPFSRYVPHFNRESIAGSLRHAGMQYLYMGKALGGKREPPMSFLQIAETQAFQARVRQLAELAARRKTVIMCGEENPARCHRRMLITPALQRLGVEVLHIRGDGRVLTDDEVEQEATGGQASLDFDSPGAG